MTGAPAVSNRTGSGTDPATGSARLERRLLDDDFLGRFLVGPAQLADLPQIEQLALASGPMVCTLPVSVDCAQPSVPG